ncbi:MAG: DUF433 domain-containing protein, partial [Bacteroidota bacterium]
AVILEIGRAMLSDYPLLGRDPEVLGGKPIVRGTRISVSIILEWFASGGTPATIHEAYPHVSIEAIQQALLFASEQVSAVEYVDLRLSAA